ncbi:hypothetical protein Ocin01_17840 [Orchesella cincta]|uniref:Uncharacterized protein n=1 Tax=Orchesella cincta TaxID=48709 RepID=A0A1D2M7E3_ORCCI|nr:hypothetical protein Ocin01_17840 [Orchesella cincta]
MFVLILNQIFSGFYYLFGVLYILIFQLSISTFWLPVFAIRLIAIQTAKWRPDFGEILSTTDVLLSEDVTKKHRGFVGGQTRYLHNLRFRRAIEGRNPKAVGKVFQRLTQPIPINLVKKVAHRYNVRVPAVLMALVGENLTKIFEKSEKVPKTAYASYGVPMPNHPGRLTNHVKVGMMTISLSTQNIVARMKELNDGFLKLKDNPTTNVIRYLGSVFGSLFPPMTKFFLKHSAYVPFLHH